LRRPPPPTAPCQTQRLACCHLEISGPPRKADLPARPTQTDDKTRDTLDPRQSTARERRGDPIQNDTSNCHIYSISAWEGSQRVGGSQFRSPNGRLPRELARSPSLVRLIDRRLRPIAVIVDRFSQEVRYDKKSLHLDLLARSGAHFLDGRHREQSRLPPRIGLTCVEERFARCLPISVEMLHSSVRR
jgi:hypothetical protein